MKKTATIICLLIGMTLLLNACGDTPSGTDPQPEPDPPIETPTDETDNNELSGRIDTDSVLVNVYDDPEKADYLVTGNLSVNAKLTIKPGVVIHFKEGLGVSINNEGILVAVGKADSTIVFTGESQSANGFWRGINIHSNSVENKISHAKISYAGSSSAGTYFEAAALTIDRAKIQLSYITISHSGGYGIQTRRAGSEFPMVNMVFEKNDNDHAHVDLSQLGYFDSGSSFDGGYVAAFGGRTTADMVIDPLDGAKYKIESSVDLEHNITINEGTTFEFAADAGLFVRNGSTIRAVGTVDNRIVFTGTAKVSGAWRGIFVSSSSVANIFKYVDISYGGSTNMATYFDKANMVIDRAKITLQHVSFTGSAGYGIQTRRAGSVFSLENSSFDNNADSHMRIHPTQVGFIDDQTNFNGGDVEVYKGDTEESGSVTWSNLNNGMYYFSGSVGVENELTIAAGAQFEMGADVIFSIKGGTDPAVIRAVGTLSEPIVFSGKSKAKGAWGGILVTSGSVDNYMKHVKIEYGGGKDLATYMDAGNLGIYNDGSLTVSNIAIENSANYGIILREGRGGVLNSDGSISYSANNNDNLYKY